MNRIRAGISLKLFDNLLEPLLEVAAVARAGEEACPLSRAEHQGRVAQHVQAPRHGRCGRASPSAMAVLPTPGFADEQRILLPAAEPLNGAVRISGIAADQRSILPSRAFLLRLPQYSSSASPFFFARRHFLAIGILVGAAHRDALPTCPGRLAITVADVVHRVVSASCPAPAGNTRLTLASAKIATSTFRQLLVRGPEDWTWITARWITR